ncbi:hypothetical protein NPIL_121841 [Nephila pilipes]|uniref:Uncharacterized protein n=1 Tax=Nephila pilipes TaxID=299642 RepID=A0A8X6UAK5_NEPPI|nr:hypothetical protein NPIL_121841 [Nephila pilipes]
MGEVFGRFLEGNSVGLLLQILSVPEGMLLKIIQWLLASDPREFLLKVLAWLLIGDPEVLILKVFLWRFERNPGGLLLNVFGRLLIGDFGRFSYMY